MSLISNKIIIMGNSGSGKTFLAHQLASLLNLPIIHLDKLFWSDQSCTQHREKDLVLKELENQAGASKWIIEGVFGDLIESAIPSADLLIFLDLSWSECQQALLQRGPQIASQEDFQRLIKWASEYNTRKTLSSYYGHSKIYNEFKGRKLRFKSREDIQI